MNDKVLVVSMLIVVMVVFSVTMVYVGSYLDKHQSTTNVSIKEYLVFEHDINPFRAYTSQGIYLFQTEEELDQLELNHTYMCEETYSNISLANCIEVNGA